MGKSFLQKKVCKKSLLVSVTLLFKKNHEVTSQVETMVLEL